MHGYRNFYSAMKKNRIMSFTGKMSGTGSDHVKQNKSNSKREILRVFFSLPKQNLDFKTWKWKVNNLMTDKEIV